MTILPEPGGKTQIRLELPASAIEKIEADPEAFIKFMRDNGVPLTAVGRVYNEPAD